VITRISLAFFLLLLPAAAADYEPWTELFGSAAATGVVGNGGLTAGLDDAGRIVSCRWPSPSYSDQLTVTPDRRASGAHWALRIGETTYWPAAGDWDVSQTYSGSPPVVLQTRFRHTRPEIEAVQTLFVHPGFDVLVCRIEVVAAPAKPAVYWFQNFTPCTRVLPEAPVADWALDSLNDFAAFADWDRERVYQFRPERPSAADWSRVRNLNSAGPETGSNFAPGVWIATASEQRVRAMHCGIDGHVTAAVPQIEQGRLEGRRNAVGPCHSALELEPAATNDGYEATLYIAFGRTRSAADAQLAPARTAGYQALLDRVQQHWNAWLAPSGLAVAENPEAARLQRALLTMGSATDRGTGVVVRAPVTQPPLAYVAAKPAAFIAAALARAGYPEAAARQTRFLAGLLREKDVPGMPEGSLTAAAYSNGVEAAPHLVLDVAAPAWLLSAAERHGASRDPGAEAAYLRGLWPRLAAAADFLAGWKYGRSRRPLPSFSLPAMRDRAGDGLTFTVFMGLNAAIRIASTLDEEPPDQWTSRARELEALIKTRLVRPREPWRLDSVLAYWLKQEASWPPVLEASEVEVDGARVPLAEVKLPAEARTGAMLDRPDAFHAALTFLAVTDELYGGAGRPGG